MESTRLSSDDEVVAKTKNDVKTAGLGGVPDIGTLDIESRLSPQPVKDEPRINGLHQANGVCESPQRSAEANSSLPECPSVETSHLNQLGEFEQ